MKYFFLLSVIITSCTPSTKGPTAEEKITIEEEARQALEDYQEKIRANGLLAEFSYLDSSDQFFWVPPGYTSALNYDEVADAIRKNADGIRKLDNHWEELKVIALSKRLASYTGRMKSITTDTSGQVTTTVFVESGILIKRDGWKLLSGQTAVVN